MDRDGGWRLSCYIGLMMNITADLCARLVGGALGTVLMAAPIYPAFAQDAASSATTAELDPETAARLTAQRDLTDALARIAAVPNDGFALSQAGRAALMLGDARAAIGFLARAEAQSPRDPVIKAAMGAAMVQLEDPVQAMRYFDAAIAAGGLDRTYVADRGLAYDLMGDPARAQADYALAAQSHPSAELTRRHAISLGIMGQVDRAVQMLGPLLRSQDRAAWRSRAMILAMNDRASEAREIARATMPRQLADGLEPYFAMMDRLTPAQLASAAHFGRFPSYDVVRAQPSRTAARVVVAAAAPPSPPSTGSPERSSRRAVRDRRTGANGRNPERVNVAVATPVPTPQPSVAPTAMAPAISSAPPPPPAPPPEPVRVSAPVVQRLPDTVQPAAMTSAPAAAPVPTAPLAPPASAAPVAVGTARAVAGPPDVRPPGVIVVRPASAAAPAAPAAIAEPRPIPAPAAPIDPAPAPAPAPAPLPVPPAADTRVVAGWSLDSMVAAIDVPEAERTASAEALSMQEIEAIAAASRERQRAEAAAARATAAAEAEARRRTEVEARRRAEAEAAAREAAEQRRRHPARLWVQIATGADVSALGFDCRRLARQYAASFAGQNCATAAWNRTRRLVVGPFRNAAAARDWLSAYTRAGGDGFVWSSDLGEEVTPIGR